MTLSPVQTDTKLAELYNALTTAEQRLAMHAESAKREAGATFYYRRRNRVTDMTLEEAEAKITAALREQAPDADDFGYTRLTGIGNTSSGQVRHTLAGLAEQRETIARLEADMAELEATYTGWSRFFLVTSSAGHVHSSMHCSTCRPTTAYGWLPNLSGKTEAEAVAELGPNLCSVCFPSAPVEHVGGKITKAAAAKLAA